MPSSSPWASGPTKLESCNALLFPETEKTAAHHVREHLGLVSPDNSSFTSIDYPLVDSDSNIKILETIVGILGWVRTIERSKIL